MSNATLPDSGAIVSLDTREISRRAEALQKMNNNIASLEQTREKIKTELKEMIDGLIGAPTSHTGTLRTGKTRTIPQSRLHDLPRGAITLAMLKAMEDSKKPMGTAEIVEAVKENPMVKNADNIEDRIKNVLNTSKRVARIARGTFKPAFDYHTNTLFERLDTKFAEE